MKLRPRATPVAIVSVGMIALAIAARRWLASLGADTAATTPEPPKTGRPDPTGLSTIAAPDNATLGATVPAAPIDMRKLASLVVASGRHFLRLTASGALRLRRDRVGERFSVDQGGSYEIFRETVSDLRVPANAVILVVGFRLRLVRSSAPLHWLFQRACILTTPFWSGFRGFHIKLWMVDPGSRNYLGIYEWDGAATAQTYVDALVRVLRPLSTRGSVWYRLYPGQALEPFLQARKLGRTKVGAGDG